MSSTEENTQQSTDDTRSLGTIKPEAMNNLVQFVTTLIKMDEQYQEWKKWNKSKEEEVTK